MKISDIERRAAAARLRQFLSEPWDERSWYHDGLQNVGSLVGTSVGENIIMRLADLIDRPTCRNIGGEEGTNGEHYGFFCTACGYAAGVTEPNCCPNCGAEVVGE